MEALYGGCIRGIAIEKKDIGICDTLKEKALEEEYQRCLRAYEREA